MIPLMLLAGFVVLILVLWLTSHSSLAPWLDDMTRLNPGVLNRAEWMAPPLVLEAVKRDYLAFYEYAARTLPQGWIAYGRELDTYLCNDLLAAQQASLRVRLHHDRGRVIGILRANHTVQVRHFSPDGLRCVVIDHQTEQRLATYSYWQNHRLHTQDMGDQVYVYQMDYDQKARRWKIARFIQQLPRGAAQMMNLAISLPAAVGRDQ